MYSFHLMRRLNLFYTEVLVYPVSQCKVVDHSCRYIITLFCWLLLQPISGIFFSHQTNTSHTTRSNTNLWGVLWNWKLWALASNQRLKIKRVLRSMFRRLDMIYVTLQLLPAKKICDTTASVHDSGQRNISMCPLPAPHLSDPLPEVFIMAFTDVHPRRARKLIPRTALVAVASNFHNC